MLRPWLVIRHTAIGPSYAPKTLTHGFAPSISARHTSIASIVRAYARHVQSSGATATSTRHSIDRQDLVQAASETFKVSTTASDGTVQTRHKIDSESKTDFKLTGLPSDIAGVDAYIIKQFLRLINTRGDLHKKENNGMSTPTSIVALLAQFDANTSRILDSILPGESVPRPERRLDFNSVRKDGQIGWQNAELHDNPVVLLAHITLNEEEKLHKIALCSGFFIDAQANGSGPILVSCAHTLEEVGKLLVFRCEASESGVRSYLRFHRLTVPFFYRWVDASQQAS